MQVYGCGENNYGQLSGNNSGSGSPKPIYFTNTIVFVGSGPFHSYGMEIEQYQG